MGAEPLTVRVDLDDREGRGARRHGRPVRGRAFAARDEGLAPSPPSAPYASARSRGTAGITGQRRAPRAPA
ncbi:hypothetical protein [Streptomyces sp. NPDC058632]|uniref:hypothetical protein n=1 Tax=unclassified Streptomyces TaxID=2593676 RepID=UPI003661E935